MKKQLKNIQENILLLKKVPKVTLVAVIKNQTNEDVQALIDLGIHEVAENRVQALIERARVFPNLTYHLIGRLQTNKVRMVLPYVSMIQSIASIRLLQVIQEEASKQGRIIDILFQINPGEDVNKQGFSKEALEEALIVAKRCPNVRVKGLMCMAMQTDDQMLIEQTFLTAKAWYDLYDDGFEYLSMGMSGDYQIALSCYASMIRVGSLLFEKA